MGAIDIKSAGKIYPNGTRALEDVNITINDIQQNENLIFLHDNVFERVIEKRIEFANKL